MACPTAATALTCHHLRRPPPTTTDSCPLLLLLPLCCPYCHHYLPLLLRPLRRPCPLPILGLGLGLGLGLVTLTLATRFDELHRAHRWVGARANDATFRLRMLPLTHPLLCSALGWLRLDQERLANLHAGIPSLPVCSLAHSLPHLDTCVRAYPLA